MKLELLLLLQYPSASSDMLYNDQVAKIACSLPPTEYEPTGAEGSGGIRWTFHCMATFDWVFWTLGLP